MGNAHALRGRLTPALILAALLALAVIVMLGVMARPAAAQTDFTTCASSTACHDNTGSSDAFHTKAGHAAAPSCTTCHVNGFAAANKGVTPKACMTCHAPASSVVTKTTHATQGCGTTAGCHGVPNTPPPTTTPTPTPTATAVATTLTVKVTPGIVKMGKKVKVTGLVGPAAAKIGFKVVRKVGTKWVKMKAPATATVSTTGAYTWTYKTVKKGAHKVTLTVKATTAYTFKTMTKSFKVK